MKSSDILQVTPNGWAFRSIFAENARLEQKYDFWQHLKRQKSKSQSLIILDASITNPGCRSEAFMTQREDVVFPEYHRKPIDFTCLDKVGLGGCPTPLANEPPKPDLPE